MKMRHLIVAGLALSLAAACTDDTAGGIPSLNNTTGADAGADTSLPEDMGNELGRTGDACAADEECESGICLDGFCAEACTGDDDCPTGTVCEELDNGVFACVPELPCTANSDCSDSDVCVVDRGGAEVDLTCDNPVGGGDVGGTCSTDADCASGLCLDGQCSAPCDTSNDCATDGSFVCEIETISAMGGGTADVSVCRPRPADVCLSDGQCTGTDRCVATKTSTDLTFNCGDAVGAAESGEACSADADCAQNLCVDGLCAGPCEGVGDCGGDPNRCEVTNVDLGSGAMDSAQICLPPISCGNQGDCPSAGDDVCYVREAAGAIDPICRAENPGGGTLGQVCTGDSECANNFCLETRFRDVCSVPCTADADCGVAGYECGTVAVDLSGGGTQEVSMCVPSAPPACTAESDCGTGLDCAIVENAAGNGLESVCVPATGGTGTGTGCTADDECQSLVCLNGFCAAPCDDSAQCAQGQLCLDENINKGGNSGNFDVCSTLGDQQCTSTDDCTDGTRVCGQIRTNSSTNEQEGFCRFPNVGEAQLGADCTTGNDCREGICLSSLSGECTVICDKDSDCGTSQGCTTFGDLNFCNTVCSDNTDCGAPDRFCTINGDVITNEIDQVCINQVGAGQLGTICDTGNECETGLCLRTFTYNGTSCTTDANCSAFANHTCECPIDQPNCTTGKECAVAERRCTNLCDDAGDCSGGIAGNPLTACNGDIFATRPNGGSANISACAQPDN